MSGANQIDAATGEVVELLQTLIRNRCVNTGALDSGHEHRNVDAIAAVVDVPGVVIERFEPAPGRASLVARLPGTDAAAPALNLMCHTDVVPVTPEGWTNDPFGGEVIENADGQVEIWGRGAVDMLNLTASMTIAFGHLARQGFRPRGDLILFAVADEEAGSSVGARWIADHHPESIRAEFVLTESGGLHQRRSPVPTIGINIAEKGVAWRRLRVTGVPGHGSRPFRGDNALVTAAAVIGRLAAYRPPPRFHELWRGIVERLGLDDADRETLLDLDRIDDHLDQMDNTALAAHLHACTHMTLSPNLIDSPHEMKTNVIPDRIDIDVDIRTLPGDDTDVVEHLRLALGDELFDRVEISTLIDDAASISRIDTPLWDSLQRAIGVRFPEARIAPDFMVGFTDARIMRQLGSVAYGAALFSPQMDPADYGRRFHGNDERVDIESLSLTTEMYHRVVVDLLG